MSATRTTLSAIAAIAIVSQIGGGRGSSEAGDVGAAGTRAPASSQCLASDSYTVLEVGNDPNTDRKKITDGCWWQYPVPFLHGYVQENLGWQMCNACAVDIEFELRNVPSEALLGCEFVFDASNSARVTVRSGETKSIDCFGGQVVSPPDHYDAGARVAGQTTAFVSDDPEIEIENRQALAPTPFEVRLALTRALTRCIVTTIASGPKRLTISGEFAPMKVGASVAIIPTGPGPFSAIQGGDLVEMAPRAGALIAGQKFEKFSVSTELPAFVTDFVLRDKSGPKGELVVQRSAVRTLAACK